MYCNNGADRTIVKQNHGNWHLIEGGTLSDRAGYLSRTGAGTYLGQGRVPYRTSRTGQTSRTAPASENTASAASDSSDLSDLSDLSDKGTPAKALQQRHPRKGTPAKAPPQRHSRKGTPAPPSWLPHIMDNELLLEGGEAPFAGVPIDRF